MVWCNVVGVMPAGGYRAWCCGVMGTAVGLHDTVVWCAWCQQVAMGHGVVVRLATSNICKALRCQVLGGAQLRLHEMCNSSRGKRDKPGTWEARAGPG